jgi:hypothetical protein
VINHKLFKVFHYLFAIMDSYTEKNIRAEIAAINEIPYGDRTIEDKRRLNDLEAEILRRHFVLQSGEFLSFLFPYYFHNKPYYFPG